VPGSREVSALEADARGKGDAVWVVPRTEHVPTGPKASFGDLIPFEQQLDAAREALDSFGAPENPRRRKKAIEEARRALGIAS
jgi:hypothetical protein